MFEQVKVQEKLIAWRMFIAAKTPDTRDEKFDCVAVLSLSLKLHLEKAALPDVGKRYPNSASSCKKNMNFIRIWKLLHAKKNHQISKKMNLKLNYSFCRTKQVIISDFIEMTGEVSSNFKSERWALHRYSELLDNLRMWRILNNRKMRSFRIKER